MGFGDVLKGGMGGATMGAGIGGPMGALVGGGVGLLAGGLGGMFGGEPEGSRQRDLMMGLYNEASGRGNPQQSAYSDFRGDQSDYLKRLKAISEGQGPSLSNETMRQGIQQTGLNQTAMAAGARGNGALAARQGMNNAAGMAAQATGQGLMGRAQEQMGAMQQLGLGLYGARGQDEANNQFNSSLLLRGLQQNDATRLAALQGSLGAGQVASQQPTPGDYLMGLGGGLGQMFGQANASRQAANANRPIDPRTGKPILV